MVARGFEYGDIFMGKIKELLRDYWLVGFIVVLSLMATEILVRLQVGGA